MKWKLMNHIIVIRWSYDPQSYEHNFSKKILHREAWKIQGFNGVSTSDLIQCQWEAITNWAMRPPMMRAGHLWVSYFILKTNIARGKAYRKIFQSITFFYWTNRDEDEKETKTKIKIWVHIFPLMSHNQDGILIFERWKIAGSINFNAMILSW